MPKGVTSIEDVPADLASAIAHAFNILNWQENLTEEEMPPKWMWHLDWELEEHFNQVDLARKARYNTEGESDDTSQPMIKNEDPELKARFGR